MTKQKKKRNKTYRGQDAKIQAPQVIKVEAVNRNKVSQWWFEKKRIVRPVAIASAVALLVAWLLYELFRVLFL